MPRGGGICAARKYACLVPIRRKVGGRRERERERERERGTCQLGWHRDGRADMDTTGDSLQLGPNDGGGTTPWVFKHSTLSDDFCDTSF